MMSNYPANDRECYGCSRLEIVEAHRQFFAEQFVYPTNLRWVLVSI